MPRKDGHPQDCECSLSCKLAYWREHGGLQTSIPHDWDGPSVAQRAKDAVEEAKAAGCDPVYQGRTWV